MDFRSGRICFMEEVLDEISLALNVYIEDHQIRILKEKKSIFRLSISSVDIALFSLIRGREKSFEKWDPWVLSIFFPWNQHTQKHVVHIFPFRFNWVCIVLGRKPRRLCLTRHYAVDMVAALFVQVRRLRFCFHKVTKGYLLLYSDSHFKRPFKYSCIRTYCSNVKTRYSFFSNFLKRLLWVQVLLILCFGAWDVSKVVY